MEPPNHARDRGQLYILALLLAGWAIYSKSGRSTTLLMKRSTVEDFHVNTIFAAGFASNRRPDFYYFRLRIIHARQSAVLGGNITRSLLAFYRRKTSIVQPSK